MLNMEDKIKIFKALGNETRFKIFKNIFTGGYACSIDDSQPKDDIIAQATCVTSIAEHFDFALPTISRHLKELKDAKERFTAQNEAIMGELEVKIKAYQIKEDLFRKNGPSRQKCNA